MTTLDTAANAILLRRATAADAPECGRICYDSFARIADQHRFPTDIPSVEAAQGLLGLLFSHPGFYSLVAELDGRLAGSNCLDERNPIAGVGPITVDPAGQNRGIGRQLMESVLTRAHDAGFPGVRLVQAAFHLRSLSLYAKLGFQVREPLALMNGAPIREAIPGLTVRPARGEEAPECDRLCRRIHGHDRGGELRDAIAQGTAQVVERRGRITAYATVLGFFGHAVAESNEDLHALIAAAPGFAGSGILIPTRNAALFAWCLERGLRVVQPLHLMSMGLYNEPAGAYLPSITY